MPRSSTASSSSTSWSPGPAHGASMRLWRDEAPARAERAGSALDKAQGLSPRNRLGSLVDRELHEDPLDVRLHRFGGDAKVPGHFLVGLALSDSLENAAFARAQ